MYFLGRKRCYLVVLGVTLGVTLFAVRILSDPKIRLEIINIFLNKIKTGHFCPAHLVVHMFQIFDSVVYDLKFFVINI